LSDTVESSPNSAPADDMSDARLIRSEDLEHYEYQICVAISKLHAKFPDFAPSYLAVRAELAKNHADLWWSYDGFIITQFITSRDTGERTLFIWIACSFGGEDNCAKHLPFFEEVARDMKCTYIEAWSKRKGMERYLSKHGYDVNFKAFRKTL
jgi:hypothetical protein